MVDHGNLSPSPRQALIYLIDASLRAPKASNTGDATAGVGERPKKKKDQSEAGFFYFEQCQSAHLLVQLKCHLITFPSPDIKA